MIEELVAQRDELRRRIIDEKALNDTGAQRVKEFQRIECGYADAIEWLEQQHETRA